MGTEGPRDPGLAWGPRHRLQRRRRAGSIRGHALRQACACATCVLRARSATYRRATQARTSRASQSFMSSLAEITAYYIWEQTGADKLVPALEEDRSVEPR